MKKIKSLLIVSLFMLIGVSSFAQNKIEASTLTKEWTFVHSINGVEMYIQSGECQMGNVKEAFQYGFIKLINTNSIDKTVVFNFEIFYTDGCVGCDKNEDEFTAVLIPANTTIIGDCENGLLSILIKNPLQTNFIDFTSLQLTAIKVY